MQDTSRYAPTSWGGSPYTDLECPSGQLCLVRKLQPTDLAMGNLLGSTDLLGGLVQETVDKAKGPQDHKQKKEDIKKEVQARMAAQLQALTDPSKLDSMIDSVVVKAVVEPRLELPPSDFSDRDPGKVYVDTVSFGDKMHIFNWVMSGVDSLKPFRDAPTGDVASLESREDVQNSPE